MHRSTRPHRGFEILQRWADKTSHESRVYTSNVDGRVQRAGSESMNVNECFDTMTLGATSPLPQYPVGSARDARPSAHMRDGRWVGTRSAAQASRMDAWMREHDATAGGAPRVVVVELGAGSALPTVRRTSEAIAQQYVLSDYAYRPNWHGDSNATDPT
jgi:hypothetical protein